MTTRLSEPLTTSELHTVAALAAGYISTQPTQAEIEVLATDDPVPLTVRLTHRVLLVGSLDGHDPHTTVALAAHLLNGTPQPDIVKDHARAVLTVGEDHCPAPSGWRGYLDADVAAASGWMWTDMVDGACAALRLTLVTVTGQKLRSSATGHLLARAGALMIFE